MSQALDEFFIKTDLDLLFRLWGWSLVRDDTDRAISYLTLGARDGEQYRLRCICDNYPQAAPSVVFVSTGGDKNDPCAWPKGTPRFHEEIKPPPNCFICMPLIREGLERHQPWRTSNPSDVWDGNRHSLLDVFNHLQRLLAGPEYLGRGGAS